ncbi:serine hydrolase [Erythrobacter sp. QSSC1-22B]|uniref:serine hydrolase domain-containing protein n=1 Tax=Erythrobacter sp. QSSC1-22B TaxID=1860125 RepID=UPI00080489FF|nr:serine hydrolase [Erythrobacter sp. QSSC1-22B]OBX20528.1 serine hydrolase [Erythrobacter sp. QSSC1-22B]
MIRQTLAAAALFSTAAIATPGFAQSAQEQLDTRYDRALAAGYKALMLCGAIANAERNGATRTPESVAQWEMAGIQDPLDGIVGDLPYSIQRFGSESDWMAGKLQRVSVQWADDMPARIAVHHYPRGCALQPIGKGAVGVFFEEMAALEALPLIHGFGDEPTWRSAVDGFSERYGAGSRTTATLVIQNSRVVAEEYRAPFAPNIPQRTWSVAKSVAATLIGAAHHRGEAETGYPIDYPGWEGGDPRNPNILLDNLLRMASGRYSDTPGNRTDPLYWGGSTVDETAAHWPLIHRPATVFRYANNDTLMAVKAIEDTFEDHPPAAFFAKLGMDHTVAETDWQGNYIFSSQVWSTARDLAKFGQLYLDDGLLPDGQRILPEGWVKYVSAASGPQPEGRSMGYGAGFWLFNQTEGIPADTFAAMGNRGQYVVIVPSRVVVIVRRGEDPVGESFDILGFTRDVLAALAE